MRRHFISGNDHVRGKVGAGFEQLFLAQPDRVSSEKDFLALPMQPLNHRAIIGE